MRKILIIPSWYPSAEKPGLGTFFREQAELLAGNYEIKILYGVKNNRTRRYKKIINALKFFLAGHVTASEKTGFFFEPPSVFGFEYETGLNFLKGMNYRISLASYELMFSHIIKKFKPDLIHAHDTFIGGIAAKNINIRSGIPYIITEHNYLQLNFPSYILDDFAESMKLACRMLFVSEYQVRNALMAGLKCEPLVTGNYVNDSLFKLKTIPNADKQFSILFIGRYAFHKDFPTLVNTIIEFDRINERKDYNLIIVGSLGDHEIDIRERLREVNNGINLKFTGIVGRKEIVEYIQSADVFLSTSIAETFGVAMCEAMMCGVPVVSTNNGGFDEMFIPGINGIKTGIGDFRSLARALLSIKTGEIVFNPVNIRESVINRYGCDAFKKKISEIYDLVNE